MRRIRQCLVPFLLLGFTVGTNLFGQSAGSGQAPRTSAADEEPAPPPPRPKNSAARLPAAAVAARMSSLGFGADLVLPFTPRSNVRVGFSFLNYGQSLTEDGVVYDGTLKFRSVQALYEFFPFGGRMHVSPGLLVYNGSRIQADAFVEGGSSFRLNGVQYWSSPANPVRGAATLTVNRVAPLLLVGFGNLAPRNRRHLTFSVDAGMAYHGSPKARLSFTGAAAQASFLPTSYVDVSSPEIQDNLRGEEIRLNNEVIAYRFYPIISIGLGYRF